MRIADSSRHTRVEFPALELPRTQTDRKELIDMVTFRFSGEANKSLKLSLMGLPPHTALPVFDRRFGNSPDDWISRSNSSALDSTTFVSYCQGTVVSNEEDSGGVILRKVEVTVS